ncbi:MAG: DNA polymerase III subunit beta, partial [Chloroflexi bacterium]|nr:DNA polymerase III subunit beta [Chloroflexota bacterium]
VKLDIQGDQFTLAAADGFRLAVQHGKLAEPVAEPVAAIIPGKALQELQRLLADEEDPVQVVLGQSRNQALFRLSNVEMVSQLVQGTFPNYTQLIPQSYKTRVVVDLRDFSQASKTASIFARDGSGIIRLNGVPGAGSEGKLLVSARAEELGESTGEVPAKVEGEESKIAFNSRYLQDVLGVLEKGSVVLETTGPSSPGVFRPAEASDYVHVVMPMFVQW